MHTLRFGAGERQNLRDLNLLEILVYRVQSLLRELHSNCDSRMSTITGVPMAIRENILQRRSMLASAYEEQRRSQRIQLQVPLFIRGKDYHGEQFLELAKTLDISALGAFITCPRSLSVGEIVTLTIPAPSITSSALVPAGMPPIQARVKRQQEAGDVHLVGVEFLKPIS
jgi:PilZ domain